VSARQGASVGFAPMHMGNLVLNSLELRKFRRFQHLQIERLGRVNLIVGKNNVGKSNLLEALQMYAQRASTPTTISEMMEVSQPSKELACVLVPTNGLNREQIIKLWHGIASTELEGEVNTALRLIAPGVEADEGSR
jgi:recombinational DNA repair ATPase RecF